ncbi:MAG: DUF2169 domain-containing protein [Syntrophaceae bacterium]
MLQLKNKTPFQSQIFLFPDPQGIDTLYVVVKATFALDPEIHIAEKQQPIVNADEYWGEPGKSSLRYAAEVHPAKPGTDVIVIAEACAPQNRPVAEMKVELAVAGRTNILKVFGDRYWEKGVSHPSPSSPKPFLRMPIVYERAFGGTYIIDKEGGKVLAEARNPVGKGFLGSYNHQDLTEVGVPNIEDYRNPLKSPEDRPKPVGFGYIAPSWQPRLSYAGTYDEVWQKKRAPYLPHDFNPRFFHTAHPDLIFDKYLKGGELVSMINMSPNHKQQFSLPICDLNIAVSIDGKIERPKVNLETVLLEPTNDKCCLTWRAAVPCDKKALKVSLIDVELNKLTIDRQGS